MSFWGSSRLWSASGAELRSLQTGEKKKCCDLLSRVVGRQSKFGSSKTYLLMQGAKCCTNTCKQQTAGITLVQNAFASDGAFVYDQTLVRVPLFVTRSACGTENSRSAIRVWHEAALKETPQDPKGKTLQNEHPRIIIIIIIIIIITAVPRVMCCASWSTSFRRAAKSKTDNIRLLHNHLLLFLLLLLPIVGNVHSHRSGSRLLLLLSSSSLRSPRSALFVFRGRIYNSEKYCMAAVRRRGGRVWTPPQITNKEHRTTLRISLQKIVPHRARGVPPSTTTSLRFSTFIPTGSTTVVAAANALEGTRRAIRRFPRFGKKKGKQGKKKKESSGRRRRWRREEASSWSLAQKKKVYYLLFLCFSWWCGVDPAASCICCCWCHRQRNPQLRWKQPPAATAVAGSFFFFVCYSPLRLLVSLHRQSPTAAAFSCRNFASSSVLCLCSELGAPRRNLNNNNNNTGVGLLFVWATA